LIKKENRLKTFVLINKRNTPKLKGMMKREIKEIKGVKILLDFEGEIIIRNPEEDFPTDIVSQPFISGNAINGWLRSHMERKKGLEYPCNCGKKDCPICRLFGFMWTNKEQPEQLNFARIQTETVYFDIKDREYLRHNAITRQTAKSYQLFDEEVLIAKATIPILLRYFIWNDEEEQKYEREAVKEFFKNLKECLLFVRLGLKKKTRRQEFKKIKIEDVLTGEVIYEGGVKEFNPEEIAQKVINHLEGQK
jgi:hypothetical protein